MEELEALKFTSSGLFWDESYRASQVLRLTQQEGTAAQLRGLLALCNTAVVDVKPKHWEVQRRLSWFISSLFMDVPRPAPVARMQSWSVLTPFYAEDLLYSAKELALKNEDGISVLYFLKTVHGDEWTSFLERVGNPNPSPNPSPSPNPNPSPNPSPNPNPHPHPNPNPHLVEDARELEGDDDGEHLG